MMTSSWSDDFAKNCFDLKDKVAVITGGNGTLGAAYAQAFALHGAKVVVTARSKETLEETVRTVAEIGGECTAITGDVTDVEAQQNIVDQVHGMYGRIDILVNNAGMAFRAPAEDMPVEKFTQVLNVNVTGTLVPCQVFGKYFMKQGRGKIVNTSSVRGFCGHPDGYIAYSASKAAVDSLTKQMSTEWSIKGVKQGFSINVNAIAPTLIKSPLTQEICEDPARIAPFLARLPMGRVAETHDMIGLVMFLSSSASDFINGQIIYVDGGCTAG
ncbi:SDR family NAD(P)-dependent oxidoreductase [Vibrio hippocampi]|uniref:2-dehydro-3-deoxy-D-gluconate 5-dehydrogenase n=1 Tax=Vibrio hippocampi TaxID=654686 RepID=A0ABN8DNN5_9VIBR|nr:SDR family oxidoreductase [Vibrio hippocampi]CAH0529523.1 2-dehydro-3-deoxy-D-gluconate 5-dehydrogenase [Vibrio hippocampi]